jgi:hypothetical protein
VFIQGLWHLGHQSAYPSGSTSPFHRSISTRPIFIICSAVIVPHILCVKCPKIYVTYHNHYRHHHHILLSLVPLDLEDGLDLSFFVLVARMLLVYDKLYSCKISSVWCLILFYTFFFHFRSLYDKHTTRKYAYLGWIMGILSNAKWEGSERKRCLCYLSKYIRTEHKITYTFRKNNNFRNKIQTWNCARQEIRNHSSI